MDVQIKEKTNRTIKIMVYKINSISELSCKAPVVVAEIGVLKIWRSDCAYGITTYEIKNIDGTVVNNGHFLDLSSAEKEANKYYGTVLRQDQDQLYDINDKTGDSTHPVKD